MLIRDWVPGLAQFRGYERSWLRGDVVAGVTVAAYLVPQVMAYATVAGLPPVVGLWAALAPLAVYAVLGSSRQLSVGPESTTALMTATALAPLAAGDPGRYAALAAAAALLVGVICFVAGLVRLGFLAELLSRPVLIGYMAGVAAIMIASQLGKVSGVEVEGEEFLDQMRSFVSGVDGVHWPTIALAVSVLVVLLVLARLAPRIPGPLIAILGAALVVSLLSLDRNGIKVVGDIPSGLPMPGFTAIPLADLAAMVIPVAGIAIVAFSDNVLTARTFAVRNGQRHGRQRRTPCTGRLQRGCRSDARLSGELQRKPHRARRRDRQPHPALLGRHVGVRPCGDAVRPGATRNVSNRSAGGIGGVRGATPRGRARVQAAGPISAQRICSRPVNHRGRAGVRCALRRTCCHSALDPRPAAARRTATRCDTGIRAGCRRHA